MCPCRLAPRDIIRRLPDPGLNNVAHASAEYASTERVSGSPNVRCAADESQPAGVSLFTQHPIATLTALLMSVHCAVELAWRVGRRRRARDDDDLSADAANALLAVLGLLLAFTVSMAVGRFEARRQLVTDEANAIGTAGLRARLLPATAEAQSRPIFDRYLDNRIRWGGAATDEASQEQLTREANQYQKQLWQIAVEAGPTTPTPIFALYESALNEMIDLAAARSDARANGVPQSVIVIVSLMAVIAEGLFAGVLGRNGRKRRFDLHLLAFSTWLVVALIVDLDRPRAGWVRVSQEPLIRLKEAMHDVSPGP